MARKKQPSIAEMQNRMQELAAEMEYYLSIPLNTIEKGKYTVVVEFKGRQYDTGKFIRIC